jgi:alkanesulfonate monooxygenase SsuD/methylene tetrahydromethanopterin reductase-like flavin-dependent oxidoreductase (luciferase family)
LARLAGRHGEGVTMAGRDGPIRVDFTDDDASRRDRAVRERAEAENRKLDREIYRMAYRTAVVQRRLGWKEAEMRGHPMVVLRQAGYADDGDEYGNESLLATAQRGVDDALAGRPLAGG